jgi:hypothetical protein
VSREAGLFHCVGCGAGGDVIRFVERTQPVSFPEAVRRSGRGPGAEWAGTPRARCRALSPDFCTRREGQAHLATRGLTDPTLLKTLQIGYADGSLLKRLTRSGVREQLRALGVITQVTVFNPSNDGMRVVVDVYQANGAMSQVVRDVPVGPAGGGAPRRAGAGRDAALGAGDGDAAERRRAGGRGGGADAGVGGRTCRKG